MRAHVVRAKDIANLGRSRAKAERADAPSSEAAKGLGLGCVADLNQQGPANLA